MDDDFEIELGEVRKKKVRKGRRATGDNFKLTEELVGEPEEDISPPPKPRRQKGLWGNDQPLEDSRLVTNSSSRGEATSSDESDGADIPTLPDQEDAAGTGPSCISPSSVAQAPNVLVNRVATYRELDMDLMRHVEFLRLDNEVDLKLLAKCLSSEVEALEEEDVPWEWERTFTEVTSDILTEQEKHEEAKDGRVGE